MRLPHVAVLLRVRDGLPLLRDALESAYHLEYEGRLTVRVGVDSRTEDCSLEAARAYARSERRPGRSWIVREMPPATLFRMTYEMLGETEADRVYLLDSDNVLNPDRVSASIAACPDGKGLCLSQFVAVEQEGKAPGKPYPPQDLPLRRYLLMKRLQFADSLAQRLDMGWVRRTLLPAMKGAMSLGLGEDLVDDYFTALIAAHHGEICQALHPAIPLAIFRYQKNSLTFRSRMFSRNAFTEAAYALLWERGALGPPVDTPPD